MSSKYLIRGRIVGVFNAPNIDCSEKAFDQQLRCTTGNLLLSQDVLVTTKVCKGQQMTCLNLVFTRSPDNIGVVNCLPPLGKSDHVVLIWECTKLSLQVQPLNHRPNIWRGDFEQMKNDLSPDD
uniref:Uncharacterized protein n=1 Tax=Schistocephalus solidus TaxID=70667 RepID=A0A0X3QCD8_SCHSO